MKYEQSIVTKHVNEAATFTSRSPESFGREDDTLIGKQKEADRKKRRQLNIFTGAVQLKRMLTAN